MSDAPPGPEPGDDTPQQPIPSGFDTDSTVDEVLRGVDLTCRVAIVTSGYSCIGTEVTRALSAAGATVVVPARRRDRARNVVGVLHRVEIDELDLADLGSVATPAEAPTACGPSPCTRRAYGAAAAPVRRRDARAGLVRRRGQPGADAQDSRAGRGRRPRRNSTGEGVCTSNAATSPKSPDPDSEEVGSEGSTRGPSTGTRPGGCGRCRPRSRTSTSSPDGAVVRSRM